LSLLKAGKSIGSGYGYDIIIENNPIEKPPSEIIKQGRKSVIEWFEANKKKLNEIKVSLLGDGKAGKTSLLKRLKYNEYSDNEEQTEGINIEQFEFGKLDTFNDQNNLQDITGYFWDFGGQEIMSSTHKFFMTRRTVYIIVCEARNDGQIDVNISDWVKRIRTYAGNSKIIVAINKIDKTPGYSINKHELIKEFPQIVDIVGISCKVDINIDKIKYLLEQTIPKAELFNTEIDERWISLKDILRERTSEIPYLSKKYVKDICENICDIKSEINLKGAIEFLNDLGIILHFEEIRLDDYFVFDPEWVTCGIYKIINSKMVSDNNGEIDINKDLDFIINKEKPEKKQFYISKDKEEIEYSSQEMLYLLEIMEQFELGYHFDNKKKFLIPDLLSNEIPIDNYNRISEDPNNLRLVYQYEYLPKSIIHRLIIHLRKDIQNRWKTGVILSRFEDNSATGIITSSKNELKIYVIGKNKAKREYLSVIRYFINQLSSQIKEPNILVPLPGHDKFVEYEILIEMENDGETFYKDYKLKEKFKISKLLEGIETNEQVIIRGRNIEEHYHYHTHYHEGDKNMKIGKIEAQNGSKQVFADNIENVNMENKELNANQIGKIVDAILELPEDDQEHVSADLTIINNDGIPDNVKKISESRIKSFLKGSVPVIQSFTSSMLVEIAKKWAGLN